MPNTDARLLQTVSNNRSVDAFHQSSYASPLFQTTQTKKVSFFFTPIIPTTDHSPQMTSTSGRTKYCRSDHTVTKHQNVYANDTRLLIGMLVSHNKIK